MTEKEIVNIGIDLGTTFSSIAVYNQTTKQYECLKDPQDKSAIPSWVSFSQSETIVKVGYPAREDPKSEFVVYDMKKVIGREHKCIEETSKESWPFEIQNDGDSTSIKVYTEQSIKNNNKELFKPEEISAIVLSYLINIFKYRKPNCEIGEVVVTFPVQFSNAQQSAIETTCKLVEETIYGLKGLSKITRINEPTAAVLEYQRLLRLNGKEELKNGSKILVIDFGGGTLDINFCTLNFNRVTVEKNGGDQDFGGNNFDFVIQDIIKEKIKDQTGIEKYFECSNNSEPSEQRKYAKRKGRLRKEAERICERTRTRSKKEFNIAFIIRIFLVCCI